MTKVVILGGGTAGWLTALLLREAYADVDICVIESEDIGILGAGEGTTPDFIQVLNYCGIQISDIIKHCDGTLKLGISFQNWRGDGDDYFHEFAAPLDNPRQWKAYYSVLVENKNIKPIQLAYQLASKFKTPFSLTPESTLLSHNPYALHFNARKLAKFLSGLAEQRRVTRVEGIMTRVHAHSNDNIKCLELGDGQMIHGDFFFDCSGFARLLIGKHFQSPWISYRDYLPMDSAVPFFIPHDNAAVRPMTEAIAMSSGWIWKIPVRERYGCGYVFDSRYITSDEALKEASEFFGQPLESPRTFRFEAGTYEQCFIKNCVALGLAQGFVEPLEATSIWVTCGIINGFLRNNLLHNHDDDSRTLFNQRCRDRNQIVLEFIQHHYITDRSDSAFWREFSDVNTVLPQVRRRLDHWKNFGLLGQQSLAGFPPYGQMRPEMFEILSWLQVSHGLGHLPAAAFRHLDQSVPIKGEPDQTMESVALTVKQCVDHDLYLKHVGDW
jgi:tryptophan 7-halogenase